MEGKKNKRNGFIPILVAIIISAILQLLFFGGVFGVLQIYIKKFTGAATSYFGGSASITTDCYLPDQFWRDPSGELSVAEIKSRVASYKAISSSSNDAKLQKLLDQTRSKGYNPAVALAVWGKESTYGTDPHTRSDSNGRYEFGYILKGHGGFDMQLDGALSTFEHAFKRDGAYTPKDPQQPIQVTWIDAYTPQSDPRNAGDRKTFFTILKQAMPSQVVCTALTGSSGVVDGSMDFRNFGPGSDGFIGKWKSVDEVFAYLGGKSPSVVESKNVTFQWLGVRLRMNKDAAEAMKNVESDFLAAGTNYKIRQGDTGGYFWRTNVNNSAVISPHATGMAVDVNWNTNPNGRRSGSCAPRDSSCCKKDMPAALSDAFQKYGFFWGAKFKGVCDSMHFQYGGNYN